MTSSLLINEPPLQVLPSLAKLIGLNEAIVIQQVHYWLGKSKNKRDGRTWVYKTYAEWREEFPFWSEETIGRVIRKLEKTELLLSTDKYNAIKTDRTKWYSIHYENLNSRIRVPQDDTLEDSNLPASRASQDDTILPETTTENTTETTKPVVPPPPIDVIEPENIYTLYRSVIGLMVNSQREAELLADIESTYPLDWIKDAMEEAVRNNARKIAYFDAILKRWQKDGRKDTRPTNGKRQPAPNPADTPGYYEEAAAKENDDNYPYAAANPHAPTMPDHTFASGFTTNHIWGEVLDTLQGQLEKSTFDTWLRASRYRGYEDGVLIIEVQSENARQWLMQRLEKKVERALILWANEIVLVRYVVAGEG